MARLRVIILEQEDARTFRYVLWADVPLTRQLFYANLTLVSTWKDALVADNDALKNGSVVEYTDKLSVPIGTTLTQAQIMLQDVWQSFQNKITNKNDWGRYGSTWDGISWTMTGVS